MEKKYGPFSLKLYLKTDYLSRHQKHQVGCMKKNARSDVFKFLLLKGAVSTQII